MLHFLAGDIYDVVFLLHFSFALYLEEMISTL